jgi:hypothetical protein
MNRLFKALTFLTFLVPTFNANAGFPDDLSDVVFTEAAQVKGWNVGADLNLSIGGEFITLDHRVNANSSVSTAWPRITIFNTPVVANAWGIVKKKDAAGNDVWKAGTWEYLKPAQTIKKFSAFTTGHFRHISDTNPQVGDLFGFFVSGTIRAGAALNNIPERSKFVVFKWGTGVIFTEGDVTEEVIEEVSNPVINPAIDVLLSDDPV